jgi:ATP-dependent Clp protease ATP-binding subunit ClpA
MTTFIFYFQCIGANTPDEYNKHIERGPILEKRLQPVKVHDG